MQTNAATRKPSVRRTSATDWRCTCCGKLLGRQHGAAVLICFARGHQYRAVLPVTAICRQCKTLNELH